MTLVETLDGQPVVPYDLVQFAVAIIQQQGVAVIRKRRSSIRHNDRRMCVPTNSRSAIKG